MKKPNIINFHITDACNYTCKHCFADFKMKDLPLKDAKKVIDGIEAVFRFGNKETPLIAGENVIEADE